MADVTREDFKQAEEIAVGCLYDGNRLIQTAINEPEQSEWQGETMYTFRLVGQLVSFCEMLEAGQGKTHKVRPYLLQVQETGNLYEHDGLIENTAHSLAWRFAHRLWLVAANVVEDLIVGEEIRECESEAEKAFESLTQEEREKCRLRAEEELGHKLGDEGLKRWECKKATEKYFAGFSPDRRTATGFVIDRDLLSKVCPPREDQQPVRDRLRECKPIDARRFGRLIEIESAKAAALLQTLGPVDAPPPEPEQPAGPVAPDEMISGPALAERYGVPYGRLKGRLKTFRLNNDDGYQEVQNRRRNDPKYLYRVGTVLHLVEDLRDKISLESTSKK